MTPQEIPPGEQLMGLTSEPRVQDNLQFLFRGLIWPTPAAITSQMVTLTPANADFLSDTMGWISRVLKPDFVAPDLRSRLFAARAIVSEQDAFLARYRMDQTSIQIVVTRFRVHLVIAPGGSPPVAAMHQYLQVDQPDEAYQFDVPWQTGQIHDLAYGYQPRGSVADWRESLYYLTNGSAVKFSLQKIPIRPGGDGKVKGSVAPTEEAERHWFAANP
jgi:hypothetical protein